MIPSLPSAGHAPRRVFISSVIRGFEPVRAAAADGVRAAGDEPILVNEDAPSAPVSSRNLCLDLVDSCDVFLLLLGATAGWKTPSGQFVIEEEYDRAVQKKLPILLFLQETSRDTDAEALAQRLSDYVHGHFRKTFRTLDDLRNAVAAALNALPNNPSSPPTMADFNQQLQSRPAFSNSATLRLVVQPERQEEVIDPLRLEDDSFIQTILELGHQQPNPVFSFQCGKDSKLINDVLTITQDDRHSRNNALQQVLMTVHPSGLISIESSIVPRQQTGQFGGGGASMTVLVSDLRDTLRAAITFVDRVYGKIDPHQRHTRLLTNVTLPDLNYRTLVETPYATGQSIPMRMSTSAVVAFEQPYMASRNELAQPNALIDRITKFLQRRAKDS